MGKDKRPEFQFGGNAQRAGGPAIFSLELIARIEEQALPPEKQELLRFYMLQIARLAGENG